MTEGIEFVTNTGKKFVKMEKSSPWRWEKKIALRGVQSKPRLRISDHL